jgi:methionyl-tRNA synthetase
MSKYYITTPIYYVNDKPHVGHAYTTIAADVLARYYRAKGDEVFFLTGTDEHGAKIVEAAERVGQEPRVFVDKLAPKFEKTWQKLNIKYSQFFRTTNPEHEKLVSAFVQRLNEAGHLEKRKYTGLYCISCERYNREEELIEGKCPDHKIECVKQSEENYFFLLSKFKDRLLEKIKSGEMEIGPASRRNEIIGKIEQNLEDISISRANVKWGIPFPGDETQTIYVWFDALLNYWTATKIYPKAKNFWPADLHLMAKDILWFHAVIWPAMLLAAGEAVPKKVFAHGFFTINGAKMSKTVGNVIDPNEIVDKFGADAVRYALLRQFPFGEDGDISIEKIGDRYKELADTLGNLVQRTIVMINKYDVHINQKSKIKDQNDKSKFKNVLGDKYIVALAFSRALEEIMWVASELNQRINEKAPWKLVKEGKMDEVADALNNIYFSLDEVADALQPFMPDTAEKMKKQLETLQPEPLFPKLEI